jgi:hypothetical protein
MTVIWFRKKLRQVGEGAFGRRGRYLPTVARLTSMPSLLDILTFDGLFGSKSNILNPTWLLTLALFIMEDQFTGDG